MKLVLTSLALGSVLVAVHPQHAAACSFAPNELHELDPAFTNDGTAPSAPVVAPMVHRWDYPSSCFDIGLIDVAVSATDDAAPAERLGFQFRVVAGDPPDNFSLEQAAIAPPSFDTEGSVSLFFDYMDTAFAFDLEVRAVDLNGNVGPATVVHVADNAELTDDDHGGGCSATRDASTNALASVLTLLVLLLALRPRR